MKEFFTEHGTKLYGGITAFLGTLASLIAAGAFNELLTKPTIGWLNIFVALATAVVGGMTMARGFNNTTAQNVAKAMETAIQATPPKQSGFARTIFLSMLIAIGAMSLATFSGCVGTRQAYQAAQQAPDVAIATAGVVAEHYAAVLEEAAQLKESGVLTPSALQRIRAADNAVRPLIIGGPNQPGLRQFVERYQAVKSAQTEAELQAAVNAAVVELSKLINAVKAARR